MDGDSNATESVAEAGADARSTMEDAQSTVGADTVPPSPAAGPTDEAKPDPDFEPEQGASTSKRKAAAKGPGRGRKGQPRSTVIVKEGAEEPLAGDAMPQTPELGKLGDTFETRDHFSDSMKKLALSLGFRLASRGSYPKKPRQDLCMACTIGRRKGRRGTTKDVVQEHVACPVVVTGKLQLDEDGKVKEGALFEITQVNYAHNHPLGLGGDDDDDDEDEKADTSTKATGRGGKKGTKRKRADAESVADGEEGEDDASSVMGEQPPPVPLRLPKVGDLFRTWDDFRMYSRLAADSHGFQLGTAQSKGSSGTVVLRCSKFRDPNVPSTGSKVCEGGCEVMFKLTKSKKVEAFEVVATHEEHNHPCTSFPAPPKKKKKKPDPPHQSLLLDPATAGLGGGFAHGGFSSHGYGGLPVPADGSAPLYAVPPPAHSPYPPPPGPPASSMPPPPAGSAPLPFLFDPYTGQRLAAPPQPPNASGPEYPGHTAMPYPPPSHAMSGPPGMYPPPHMAFPPPPGGYYPYPGAPPPGMENIPPPHHLPPSHAPAATPQLPSTPTTASGRPQRHQPPQGIYPPMPALNVRFPAKAHTSISDFLTTLSTSLTPYADHFNWAGVQSPLVLLDVINSKRPGEGEVEVDRFLEGLDTAGYGRGEGLGREERELVIRGLRKLKQVREKTGKVFPS